MDSPASDLSDYDSDDFPENVKGTLNMERSLDREQQPNKRLRLNNRAASSPPVHAAMPSQYADGEISEDTDGSVPASPNHHPGMSQDDDWGQEQVTVCKWEGCDVGDVGNMDNLVDHLHDDHIGTRQKKYSCEWSDCTRKGIPHASGYALRAHMRSHTREKPFYCTLPECDRSFTRSDALAKHMRTVHETEALRPSDPVPKHHSSNPSNRQQRLKLVLTNKGSTPGSPSSHAPNAAPVPPATAAEYAHNNAIYVQDTSVPNAPLMVQFPPDMDFSERELSLSAPELYKLLRRQLQWAQEDSEKLRAEAEAVEKLRKEEWEAKELVLENLMEAEIATERRRRADRGQQTDEAFEAAAMDAAPSRELPIKPVNGRLPWWRETPQIQQPLEAQPRETPRIQQPGDAQPREDPQARPPQADIRHEDAHIGRNLLTAVAAVSREELNRGQYPPA